jgi:hypothetical protein
MGSKQILIRELLVGLIEYNVASALIYILSNHYLGFL